MKETNVPGVFACGDVAAPCLPLPSQSPTASEPVRPRTSRSSFGEKHHPRVVEEISPLANRGTDAQAELEPIDLAIDQLKTARSAIAA
jgi:hypothetical protein